MSSWLLLIVCTSVVLVLHVHSLSQCTSVFIVEGIRAEGPDEAFPMVVNCPLSWPEETLAANGRSVVSHCESEDPSLPPVTDTSIGLVYRNEYCAICNNATQIRAWDVSLTCTASAYQVLKERTISSILSQDPEFFSTRCQACKYQSPSSTHTPHFCVPAIHSCLSRTALEKKQLHTLPDETYRELVSNCHTGELSLVKDKGGRVFKNFACSECNAVSRDELSCFELREKDVPFEQCIPVGTSTTGPPTFEHTSDSPPFDATTILPSAHSIPPTKLSTSTRLPFTVIAPTVTTTLPPLLCTSGPPTVKPPGLSALEIPFTITLSSLGGGDVEIATQTDSYQTIVDCPEGEVPVGLECRPTLCPQSYSESGGRCLYSHHSSPHLNSSYSEPNCSMSALKSGEYVTLSNNSILFRGEEVEIMGLDEEGNVLVCTNITTSSNGSSQHFLDCPTGFLPLNKTEFEELGNGTILYYNQTMEVMFYDDQGRPLVCPDNKSKLVEVEVNRTVVRLLPGITELTFIGCSLSLVGSILLLLTHALFKELRTFPSFLLVNLSSAILITNVLFIAGGPVVQRFPRTDLCTAVAISLHFSYLAQFTWMSLFSFQMLHTFYLARKMEVASKRKGGIPLVCMLIGWGLPLVITLVAVGLNFDWEGLVLYGVTEEGNVGSCWINHFLSFVILFLVPLLLSLTLNLFMFVMTSAFLCQLSRRKSSNSTMEPNNTMLIRVWLAFFSITGLTWIFGFLAVPDETSWAWYPFVVFNSTQGFSIFLAFLFTRKTLKLYAELFMCRRKRGVPPLANNNTQLSLRLKMSLKLSETIPVSP